MNGEVGASSSEIMRGSLAEASMKSHTFMSICLSVCLYTDSYIHLVPDTALDGEETERKAAPASLKFMVKNLQEEPKAKGRVGVVGPWAEFSLAGGCGESPDM